MPTDLVSRDKHVNDVVSPLCERFLGVLHMELLHFVLDDVLVLSHVREIGDVVVFLGEGRKFPL